METKFSTFFGFTNFSCHYVYFFNNDDLPIQCFYEQYVSFYINVSNSRELKNYPYREAIGRMQKIYFKTYTRMGVWFVGVILGYILHNLRFKVQNIKIAKVRIIFYYCARST